jgi:hypothetical protein
VVRKYPFDAMPGLPPQDDTEVASLMEAVVRLPRDGANEVVRCVLRAALARERTGDAEYLIRLAEDMLFTVRLHGGHQCEDAPVAARMTANAPDGADCG